MTAAAAAAIAIVTAAAAAPPLTTTFLSCRRNLNCIKAFEKEGGAGTEGERKTHCRDYLDAQSYDAL